MDIIHALISLRPNAQWEMDGDDYESIEWLDTEQIKPTKEEVLAEVARLKSEFDAKEYQRIRAKEYPPIGDQLDALFHAGVFPEEMASQIQAIKNKYPKG